MKGDAHLPHAVGPADRTVPRMLQLQAARYPGQPLFRCGDFAFSFEEAPQVIARHAGWLAAQGIKRGDRVAILSANRAEVLTLILGCGWLGAVAVPLNAGAKGPQVKYYLENSGASLLVIDPTLIANLGDTDLSGGALRKVFTLPGTDNIGSSIGGVSTAPFDGIGIEVAPADVGPGDTLAILYTSGTTGAPKGVMCPHAQFYWWGTHTSRFLEVRPGDVLATPLPLFHTNALNTFFQALLNGAQQVVLPRFSASGFWRSMIETGATQTYLLGAMIPILLSQPPSEAERRHRVRVALGPGVPEHLHQEMFARTGVRLVDGYGSTETNFIIGGTAGERVPERMGRLAAGFAARVVDQDDNELAPGTAGELVVRSDEPYSTATGYFANAEKTVEAWRNLWFHTGDRVIRHADGTFAFVDRLKDSIRRRGENISAHDVEQALLSHPDIAGAAAYAVPSPLAEDEVMAALVARPGRTLDPGEVVAFAARLLPKYAVPRYIDIVASLPQTENGKIAKHLLKARGVTAATFDREAGRGQQ